MRLVIAHMSDRLMLFELACTCVCLFRDHMTFDGWHMTLVVQKRLMNSGLQALLLMKCDFVKFHMACNPKTSVGLWNAMNAGSDLLKLIYYDNILRYVSFISVLGRRIATQEEGSLRQVETVGIILFHCAEVFCHNK